MAVNLTAIFKVRDEGTAKLRKLTQTMEKMNRAGKITSESMSKAQTVVSKLGNSTSSASSKLSDFSTRVTSLRVGANGLSASLRGMQGALVGIAGAYVGANGVAKLFNATITEAAKFEQSKAVITAAFQDDGATKQYLQMVDKFAIDSPLLNSGDMFGSSKGLLTISKSIPELESAWGIVERLIASDPTKSIDDAVRGLRELSSGDTQSLREVFNIDKNILNDVKGGSFEEQLAGLDKALNKMNITQKTVEAMGSTTLGRWNSLKERVGTFFRDMGTQSNSKLGNFLKRINDAIDKLDVKSLSDKLGAMLGNVTDRAIALFDLFVKWREPIAYVAGALATFVGALAIVGTISALANPISLIAIGISSLVLGFKSLYENSESFRNVIDGIKSKAGELLDAFKADGVKGVLNAILPEGALTKLTGIVSSIKNIVGTVVTWLKTKFDEIKPSLQTLATKFLSLKDTVINALSTLLTISEPILSGLWSALQIVGDVASMVFNNIVVPAIEYAIQVIQTLWAVAEPILTLLAGAFEITFGVLKGIWDSVLKPFVEWILGEFKGALEKLTEALKTMSEHFETFKGVWSDVWDSVVRSAETAVNAVIDMINALIDTINNIPLIEIDAVANVNWSGDAVGATAPVNTNVTRGMTPGHYFGIDNVPYDGYTARLHRGETVLNAQEAKERREGQSGNGGVGANMPIINIAKMEVREKSDIQKVAYELAKYIESEALQIR